MKDGDKDKASPAEGDSSRIVKNEEAENAAGNKNDASRRHGVGVANGAGEDAASAPINSGGDSTEKNDCGKETYGGSDGRDDDESTMVGYSDSGRENMSEVEGGLLDTHPLISGLSVTQVSKVWRLVTISTSGAEWTAMVHDGLP